MAPGGNVSSRRDRQPAMSDFSSPITPAAECGRSRATRQVDSQTRARLEKDHLRESFDFETGRHRVKFPHLSRTRRTHYVAGRKTSAIERGVREDCHKTRLLARISRNVRRIVVYASSRTWSLAASYPWLAPSRRSVSVRTLRSSSALGVDEQVFDNGREQLH